MPDNKKLNNLVLILVYKADLESLPWLQVEFPQLNFDILKMIPVVWKVCVLVILVAVVSSTATMADISDLEPRLFKRQADRGLNVTWGPYVDFGYQNSPKAFITGLSTVFTVGNPPQNHLGNTFLWPGVWDPRNRNTADLIQTVAEHYTAQKLRSTCNASLGQWVS
jgi:hypothetical protein